MIRGWVKSESQIDPKAIRTPPEMKPGPRSIRAATVSSRSALRLLIVKPDGTDDTTVIADAAPGATDAWSPDSTRLAVEVFAPPFAYLPAHNISHIAVVNVATATVSSQIGGDSSNTDPAWSP